jgi:Rad3-related DNA helicase
MTQPEWIESFPFERPRQQQVDAIDHVIGTFDGGRQFQFVEMGVGCGKSAVAATLAHWTARNTISTPILQSGAYILTTQKILQDQYERDFGECVRSIKSATSYRCSAMDASCSEAKKLYKLMAPQGQPPSQPCKDACAYRLAKEAFIQSEIGITNFSFFMNDAMHARDIKKRALMVIDECHNLEASLCSLVELQLSSRSIKRMLDIELPRITDVALLGTWLRRTCWPVLRDALDALKEDVRRAKLRLCGDVPDQALVEAAHKLDALVRLSSRIKRIDDVLDDTWVLCDTSDDSDVKLTLRPTDVSNVAHDLLFSYGARVMLMSATICDPGVMASSLGISDYDYYSLPSPFDPARRPVDYTPIGMMSSAHVERTLPLLVDAVAAIMEHHSSDKGLIHTGNYRIARALRDRIKSDRAIFHDDSDRDAALRKHLDDPRPTVLFSPSMTDGVDLHDGLSRFQILCKLPFPNLLDPWVKKRAERDPRWYPWITASRIAQAVGRSVRHEDDWAQTYILDACWARFIRDNGRFFNGSFTAALR